MPTIEITLSDDGKITVGIADQPSSTDQQPVDNIQQALVMAKHLLTQASTQSGSAPDGSASPDGGAASDPSGSGDMQPSGQSEAPGAPPGGVNGPSDNNGAVSSSDPTAIWNELAAKGQPAH